MRQQTAKLLCAVSFGVGASLAFTAMSVSYAEAAECLAAPKGLAPAGSHWFYRTDHANKRKCWYVRAKDDASAPSSAASNAAPDNSEADGSTASNESASAESAVTPATALKPTRGATPQLRPGIANARAEVQSPPEPAPLQESTPQSSASQFPAPLPAMTATPDQQGAPQASAIPDSPVEQRWAEAHASDASAAATADAASKLRTAAQVAVAKGGTPAAAMATAGSAATLIAALLAALALAGLIVGGVFKFGRREPVIRRDANGRPDIWSAAAKPASSDIAAARISQDIDLSPPTQPVEPPAWIRAARQHQAPVGDGDEIEELLARAQKRPAA